jgi:N-acyl amino acid synthase of PEP-CTERM/exosortase system
MNNDLIAAFNQFFELVHADTDELRMQVYLLRYQVYVLETGFETDSDCRCGADANGHAILWEQDVFDERSDHYLLRHRRTGVFAATARLILPSAIDVTAPYPIELHCPLTDRISNLGVRARLGEISRFAVSKVFKRRIGELGSLAGVADNVEIYFEEDERRVLPHISLGLFAAVMRMVHEHHITHCYAVMEPALLRLLSRFGMVFNRIGPDVDYHGMRVPCITTAEEALPSIKRIAPSVWDLITNRGELLQEVS